MGSRAWHCSCFREHPSSSVSDLHVLFNLQSLCFSRFQWACMGEFAIFETRTLSNYSKIGSRAQEPNCPPWLIGNPPL